MRISNQNSDKDDKERMDAKSGNAKHSYVDQMNKILDELGDMLWHYVRKGHIKDHGFRKGAATECTAGTTCAPSPSSVAQRGEWSLGKVFRTKVLLHTYILLLHTYIFILK